MRCFYVDGKIIDPFIPVENQHSPHITIHARRNDQEPNIWIPVADDAINEIAAFGDGRKEERMLYRIADVDIVPVLKDQELVEKSWLITVPRNNDNRSLVLWRVKSGHLANAEIFADETVWVISPGIVRRKGGGKDDVIAEMLAVLSPGHKLYVRREGDSVRSKSGELVWDGEKISVSFEDEESSAYH